MITQAYHSENRLFYSQLAQLISRFLRKIDRWEHKWRELFLTLLIISPFGIVWQDSRKDPIWSIFMPD